MTNQRKRLSDGRWLFSLSERAQIALINNEAPFKNHFIKTAEGSTGLLRVTWSGRGCRPFSSFRSIRLLYFSPLPSPPLIHPPLVLRAATQLRSLETGGWIFPLLWQQRRHHPIFGFFARYLRLDYNFSSRHSTVLKCTSISGSISEGRDEWRVTGRGRQLGGSACVHIPLPGAGGVTRAEGEPATRRQGTGVINQM